MFTKQLRVVAVLLAALILVFFLMGSDVRLQGIKRYDFYYHVVLGALLGALLCLLPYLTGAQAAPGRFAAQWWLGAALVLLALVYQYFATYEGLKISWLNWFVPHSNFFRVILGEGVLLGYCITSAVRAKR